MSENSEGSFANAVTTLMSFHRWNSADECVTTRRCCRLTDALELWIDSRKQVAALGGQQVAATEINAWVDGMNVADPQPFRSALRKLIFETAPPDPEFLEKAVATNDLAATCSRKLSWLAKSYQLIGNDQRAGETLAYALSRHPDDLLLNFEYATAKMDEQDWGEAIRYYLRCTAIRPNVPRVWQSLSDAYRQNGEVDAAAHAMEVATRLAKQER